MGQHSCKPGPLPPACLNLAPASDDPAPPPPTGAGLGEVPARRVDGRPALVKGRWEDVYGEGESDSEKNLWGWVRV